MVYVQQVASDSLQTLITAEKQAGRRILAVTISKFSRTSLRSKDFVVTEYTVITQ